MKVIPFPGGGSASPDEAWLAELEAALNGESRGASADSWRELRTDVRGLAPPMDPAFERQLRERIAERDTRPRGARSAPQRPHRRWGWLRRPSRLAWAGILAPICAAFAIVFVLAPWRPAGNGAEHSEIPFSVSARSNNAGRAFGPVASAPAESAASASAGAVTNAPAASGTASAPGRVQQLGASITLTATPNDVQETADRVSRLVVSDGGFVQSSHVNVGQGTGEANLTLSLPSAKLSAALAALGQLAPVHAESQSLQDITNTYDAARQRLSDATAERQALLRALSKAITEGQIDSLRERLSQNQGRIAQTRSALQVVSRRASTAEVEVTVVGDAHAGSEGLTLHRGLHDAGRVLVVTLVVLLIAAAILVPLALLLLALLTVRRAWLTYRRERALDTP
jgi:hypothetical protein